MGLLLITVTGADKPGVTSSITRLLSQYEVDILDIGQAVIHRSLNLGILVTLPGESRGMHTDLEALAQKLELSVSVSPITENDYDDWVSLQGRDRTILTLLARRIQAHHIARVTSIIFDHGLNIDGISRLSGRVHLAKTIDHNKACIEFSLKGQPAEPDRLRRELMAASNELDVDIAIQKDTIFRRNRRLIVFDMDSTLIDTEVIDELALKAGVGKEVMDITHAAMKGEIDFGESLKRRVKAIAGLDERVLAEIAEGLPLMEGAQNLFSKLQQLGYKTAILSGGFTYFADALKEKLGVDYVFANELKIVDGKLNGEVYEPIVDAQRKADLVKELAARENISLQQVIAVGDGANDLAMLGVAGMGIAFHAKPIVKEKAGHAISNMGLDSILYLMGIRDRDSGLV